METAVGRILVLGPATFAHREARHRREWTVIGDPADDRKARTAVGAVDERVAIAAVAGVEQLAQAVGAGRAVGRDGRVDRSTARAVEDLESTVAVRLALLGEHPLDR